MAVPDPTNTIASHESPDRQAPSFWWLIFHDAVGLPAFVLGWLVTGGWLSVTAETPSTQWRLIGATVLALSVFATIEGVYRRTIDITVTTTCIQLLITASAGFLLLYQMA